MLGKSASSLALRRQPDLASRLAHGQLLAVRTSSIDAPGLAIVQRIRIEADGEMSIAVRPIRGEARGAAVRGAGNIGQKYERALVLDADAQRGTPASLIVASGLFAPGARVEIHSGRAGMVRVGQYIESGFDFDRLAFDAL